VERPFARILVGVDLTLSGDRLTFGCQRAVEQALEVAARSGAELVFLHSTWADLHEENHALRPGPSGEGLRALEELVERAAQRALRARVKLARDRAWLELIRSAKEGEGDLVLVARRNQEGAGATVGGIARKLLRKCPCPVWVVRPEGRAVPRTIVAATDLSEVGERVVALGAVLAGTFAARLVIVHAWPLPLSVPVLPELDVPAQNRLDVEQHEAAARARFERSLAGVALPPGTERHLACGAPSVVIRDRIEQDDADLLLMGTVSRSGIAGLLMGNTAERLLDRVPCSLLTLKPRDFVPPV
jgi:universal stress protein E